MMCVHAIINPYPFPRLKRHMSEMSRNIAYQYGWASNQERGGYIAIAWMNFTTFQKDGHEVRPSILSRTYAIHRIFAFVRATNRWNTVDQLFELNVLGKHYFIAYIRNTQNFCIRTCHKPLEHCGPTV
jgi:hypothetical protein